MLVRELMTKGLVTVDHTATCQEVAQRMVQHRVRHVPVVGRGGGLRGIVTDRDLRHYLFEPDVLTRLGSVSVDALLKSVGVSRVMSAPVVSVDAGERLEEAARRMRADRIGALPVQENGRPVGIITETDLLRRLIDADRQGSGVEAVVVSYP
jgi:acetoin utilization protein AcuB